MGKAVKKSSTAAGAGAVANGGGDEDQTSDEETSAPRKANVGSKKAQAKKPEPDLTHALPMPVPMTPSSMDPKDAQAMFQSLSAEADKLAAGGWYLEALERYNRALGFHPDDASCLVNRSRCHMMLGDTAAALEDATKSLELDPTFIRGIFQKAEALYAGGHFEDALVLYHRGNKVRPELEGFTMGIHKATEAIRNAVALLDTVKLRKKREKVKRQWAENGMNGVLQDHRSLSPNPSVGMPSHKSDALSPTPPPHPHASHHSGEPPGQNQLNTFVFRTRSESAMAMSKNEKEAHERNLLEELYEDKSFLEELSRDDRFMSAGGGGGGGHGTGEVGKLVEEGLRYLKVRVEFWRQRNPGGVPASTIAAAGSDHHAATRQKILRHRGVALSNAVAKRQPAA
ncbi:Tetratricopeptide repeat protein 25 [Phlyctochytrium planicorne]|nr:Tetratricopeptide repeat protein 25 [Phlyctochytrium planicorne]